MQGLTHATITTSEKCTFNARLNVKSARLDVKSQQSHSSMKSRSRVLGRSACLKSIWRTTRAVRGSDYSPTAALSEEKYI